MKFANDMTRHAGRAGAALALALAATLFSAGSSQVLAQNAAQPAAALPQVSLTAGRSIVLPVDFDVTRIAITNPAVADAVVVAPREILIDGKAQGTISLIVWGDGRRIQYDVSVEAPVTQLQQQLRNLFPGEDIQVTVNEEQTTLSGRVSSNAIMLKAGEIAEKTSAKQKVINLLQVPGGIDTQQVMLQVRFAEVNRQALTEAGISLFMGANAQNDWAGRVTTQQFSAPTID